MYVFRTPSNEKIEVDSSIYFFRDIITVGNLKFLFTCKERLYSMEMFELAFFNKETKEKEILDHNIKLCDLQIDEYLVIHVDVPKKIEVEEKQVEIIEIIDTEKVEEKTEKVEEDPVQVKIDEEEKIVEKKFCVIF